MRAKKSEVGEADPAHAGDGAGAQEGDEAGDPEEGADGVELLDLGVEEGQEGEDDVLVAGLPVVEELEGGPVVVDLPEEVGAAMATRRTRARAV